MCNNGTITVVIDDTHELAMSDAIVVLTGQGVLFTAFDVTRTARAANGGKFLARHKVLKAVVRRMFQSQEFPANYSRELVDLGSIQTFVYHPDGTDPQSYDPQALFPDGDVSQPAPAVSSPADGNATDGNATDAESRLNIPQKLLATMNLSKGDKVYIELDNTEKEIKITPIPVSADYDTLTINANGSIRISQTVLVRAFGAVGVYDIVSNDEPIACDIVITVSPV